MLGYRERLGRDKADQPTGTIPGAQGCMPPLRIFPSLGQFGRICNTSLRVGCKTFLHLGLTLMRHAST